MIVVETKKAIKALNKLPKHVKSSYSFWRHFVEKAGTGKLREIKSYHYEALKGIRKGQHSCRLSKGYRVIFEVHEKEIIVKVLEVNKHEY